MRRCIGSFSEQHIRLSQTCWVKSTEQFSLRASIKPPIFKWEIREY